jgi:hypothetical protein
MRHQKAYEILHKRYLKSFFISQIAFELGTVHYLWRGVAPKRKGLGKLNFE